MTDLGGDEEGETRLTPDELAQLIPGHIQTRSELDELEAENIRHAITWLARRRRRNPLSINFMRDLHHHMYGEVWRWAGQFSLEYHRPLGADANQIEPDLRVLIDDCQFWIEDGSFPDPSELLATFHHRLTRIHPFPNGNGRWARLMTDVLAEQIDASAISWGGATPEAALHQAGTVERVIYIEALQTADGHDLCPLSALIRTWSTSSEELP